MKRKYSSWESGQKILPLQVYSGYRWDLLNLDAIIREGLKDYVPYIEDIGNGLYKVNGNKDFYYITSKQGAEEADKALHKAAEEYGK